MRLGLLLSCIAVVTVASISGCGRRSTPVGTATQAHTLLVGNGAEPTDLDPPVATAFTDMNILNALFEGLTFIDERSTKPVPGVAERWEPSSDGLEWTFHLRTNAAWSNGEPLVADDFVQSFRRTVSPRMAFGNASYLFALKNAEAINSGKIEDAAVLGCRATDPHTLVLTLEHPTPELPLLTALTPWFPINPRALERFDAMRSRGTPWTRAGNLVGNGAFLLKEWTPNSRVVVVKNPHYWDAAHTTLQQVEFFPIDNPDAEEHAFRAGQLHVTLTLPVSKVAYWREHYPDRLRIDPFLQTVFIAFNTKKAPFGDARVRRAFALAIDRTALSRSALVGIFPPAFAATPPDTGGYTAKARSEFNPGEAQQLLAAAGFPGGKGLPALTLQVRNADVQPVVAEALQAMWQKTLGVQVALTPVEQKTWLQNQQTLNYSISTFSWVGDFPDPITFLGLFKSDNGNNWTGWSDPDYDALISSASIMSDADRRRDVLQQAEAHLLESAPVTPLYHGTQTYLIQPTVRDWLPASLGIRRYQSVRVGE